MMKTKSFDYIILGGGCAALSLASNISDKNINNLTFLILEKRKKYTDDRSWCFWSEKKNTLNKLISYSWDNFSFSLKKKNVMHRSKKYNYKYVRSIDFYNSALEKIKKAPNIDLYLGELIKKIYKKKNNYLVYTQKRIYVTKYIIDTRPRKNIYLKEPFLFQSFLGYELEVKDHDSKFDTAKVMDDMRLIKGIFVFDYVLPFGKNKFLIEVTTFSEKEMSIYSLQAMLNNTLRKYRFEKYKIIRKEYGVIPMGFIDNNLISKKKNYFLAGTLGGAVRPSSGYAFLRIQEWAMKCTKLLQTKNKIISHQKEKLIEKKLDMIFLRTLINNPQHVPNIFYIFLKRVSTDTLIRFMSGNASIIDYLKVIFSMPKRIFLKSLYFKRKKNAK